MNRLLRTAGFCLIGGALALALADGARQAVQPKESPEPASPGAAKDSVEALVPLAKRPGPKGLFISTLVRDKDLLWAVGDSGLVAHSRDDSSFTRLESPIKAALHCADLSGRTLVCAGDSGRVALVSAETVTAGQLDDSRAVRSLDMAGSSGLLGGDEGLLASTADGGRTWRVLRAPLPMRFSAVLIQDDRWWAGGAGGRLFFSDNQGVQWQAGPRLPHPVADLASGGAGGVVVLDRQGGLHRLQGEGLESLLPVPDEWWMSIRANSLSAWDKGWVVAGDQGRLAILDTVKGNWSQQQLSPPASLSALCADSQGLLLGGAWSSLARWRPEQAAPVRIGHSLAARRQQPGPSTQPPAEVAAVRTEAGEGSRATLQDSVATGGARLADTKGPRYFQNTLDTPTRCSTVPTRMRQLERSYDNGRWVGVAGRVMLAADVNVAGGLDSVFVLDEWPLGLGMGDQAKQMAASLTFTPGFRGSAMVASRMLLPISFPGAENDYLAWAKGERQAGGVMDSLIAAMPKVASGLEPKALVKAMDFPRKAKRYLWEGAAVVEYRLGPEAAVDSGRVLWESDAKYAFGEHALKVIPHLDMRPPAGVQLAAGDHLRVVQRLNFDRKRYDRARKEVAEGFQFAPVLFSQVQADSCRYQPGLAQLEWLLNDFIAAKDSTEWPELHLQVILRQDGRLHEFQASPLGTGRELDCQVLRSLALNFTWGQAPAVDPDHLDTLSLRWKPASFKADSLNAPPSLRALLRKVVY